MMRLNAMSASFSSRPMSTFVNWGSGAPSTPTSVSLHGMGSPVAASRTSNERPASGATSGNAGAPDFAADEARGPTIQAAPAASRPTAVNVKGSLAERMRRSVSCARTVAEPTRDAHQEHDDPGDGDHDAHDLDAAITEPRRAARREHEGQREREHAELAELDAQVERHEGDGELRARQRDLAQRAREAEPVDEAERERDAPATARVLDEQVLDADVGDRERDRGLDEAWARREHAERGE